MQAKRIAPEAARKVLNMPDGLLVEMHKGAARAIQGYSLRDRNLAGAQGALAAAMAARARVSGIGAEDDFPYELPAGIPAEIPDLATKMVPAVADGVKKGISLFKKTMTAFEQGDILGGVTTAVAAIADWVAGAFGDSEEKRRIRDLALQAAQDALSEATGQKLTWSAAYDAPAPGASAAPAPAPGGAPAVDPLWAANQLRDEQLLALLVQNPRRQLAALRRADREGGDHEVPAAHRPAGDRRLRAQDPRRGEVGSGSGRPPARAGLPHRKPSRRCALGREPAHQ